MAQSEACPTGDQVTRSIPNGPATFVQDLEIWSTVILFLPLIQEGQLSVYGLTMCTGTGQPPRGVNLPSKSVLIVVTRP